LASEKVNAKIGLMISFDDLWALQIQPHHPDFDYLRLIFTHYCAFQRLGLVVDFIIKRYRSGSLFTYCDPKRPYWRYPDGNHSCRQAQKGKVVLLGIRSGFKTSSNMVTTQSLPGVFKELIGGIITDWHSLPPDQSYPLQSEQIPSLGNAACGLRPSFPRQRE
jgi:beta-galactosidase